MSRKSIKAGLRVFALKNVPSSSKCLKLSVFIPGNNGLFGLCDRSLESTLKQRKTKDMSRAQRLFDDEMQSVASREYDPSNLDLRGNRFRKSYQETPRAN